MQASRAPICKESRGLVASVPQVRAGPVD